MVFNELLIIKIAVKHFLSQFLRLYILLILQLTNIAAMQKCKNVLFC